MTKLLFSAGARRRPLTIVRRSRARTMRLAVDPADGTVRLTLPPRMPVGAAIQWAESKRDWIESQLSNIPEPQPIEPGMSFMLAGEQVSLEWQAGAPRRIERIGGTLRLGGALESVEPRLIRYLRKAALELLRLESHEIAARESISLGTISVGDPARRWGSCTPEGNLRYSWRLILAPSDVRRATVAHEVAHRLHMDHSPAFHAAVDRLLGTDARPARRWLKRNGAQLHAFGIRA